VTVFRELPLAIAAVSVVLLSPSDNPFVLPRYRNDPLAPVVLLAFIHSATVRWL